VQRKAEAGNGRRRMLLQEVERPGNPLPERKSVSLQVDAKSWISVLLLAFNMISLPLRLLWLRKLKYEYSVREVSVLILEENLLEKHSK
jgi:hypothetical protein